VDIVGHFSDNRIYSSVELMVVCPAYILTSLTVPGCVACQDGSWDAYVRFVVAAFPNQSRELDSFVRWPIYSNSTYLMEFNYCRYKIPLLKQISRHPNLNPPNTSVSDWAWINVTVCMDDNTATTDELLRNEDNLQF
jgi:hypothetical protein